MDYCLHLPPFFINANLFIILLFLADDGELPRQRLHHRGRHDGRPPLPLRNWKGITKLVFTPVFTSFTETLKEAFNKDVVVFRKPIHKMFWHLYSIAPYQSYWKYLQWYKCHNLSKVWLGAEHSLYPAALLIFSRNNRVNWKYFNVCKADDARLGSSKLRSALDSLNL